jgi:hypothetical protein
MRFLTSANAKGAQRSLAEGVANFGNPPPGPLKLAAIEQAMACRPWRSVRAIIITREGWLGLGVGSRIHGSLAHAIQQGVGYLSTCNTCRMHTRPHVGGELVSTKNCWNRPRSSSPGPGRPSDINGRAINLSRSIAHPMIAGAAIPRSPRAPFGPAGPRGPAGPGTLRASIPLARSTGLAPARRINVLIWPLSSASSRCKGSTIFRHLCSFRVRSSLSI